MQSRSARASTGFRHGHSVDHRQHDPYRSAVKLAGTSCCSGCGAVHRAGRWSWRERPRGAAAVTCPACLRIRDAAPAGLLRLEGDFGPRKAELLGLIRNAEGREKSLHPLERLMSVRQERGALLVETTGIHLARRIADALRRAFHRDAKMQFLLDEDLVRVTWKSA